VNKPERESALNTPKEKKEYPVKELHIIKIPREHG